jgi:CBS-domain-containing membrane protein
MEGNVTRSAYYFGFRKSSRALRDAALPFLTCIGGKRFDGAVPANRSATEDLLYPFQETITMTRSRPTDTAADLMTSHVRTVEEPMSLAELVPFLTEHELSFAPVVKADGGRSVVVGVIGERDCMDHLADDLFYGSPRPPRTVATMMKRHPVCVAPETDLFSLCSLFAHHGLRHAPVTDEDGHLLGVVSRRDILRALEKVAVQTETEQESRHFRPDLRQVINLRYFPKG